MSRTDVEGTSSMVGAAADKGLSSLQREILMMLMEAEEDGEAEELWGVRLRLQYPTRAESAGLSRAVRRLEQRGLLQRRNQHTGDKYCDPEGKCARPHPRHTHLLLTELGREVGRRLIQENNG